MTKSREFFSFHPFINATNTARTLNYRDTHTHMLEEKLNEHTKQVLPVPVQF